MNTLPKPSCTSALVAAVQKYYFADSVCEFRRELNCEPSFAVLREIFQRARRLAHASTIPARGRR